MKIAILRLGHRIKRDKRLSTHVFLVARAFGVNFGFYSGQKDQVLENSIKRVVQHWGGSFKLKYAPKWKNTLQEWTRKAKIVHLTCYGMPLNEKIAKIRQKKSLLVIVGGAKVPSEAYKLADFNISVTTQPHSEAAALAIFLHEYFEGKEFKLKFPGAKLKVIPQPKGKKVVSL